MYLNWPNGIILSPYSFILIMIFFLLEIVLLNSISPLLDKVFMRRSNSLMSSSIP